MNYLSNALFCVFIFSTYLVNAQSDQDKLEPSSSFRAMDSVKVDLYKSYDPDRPPINLNNLRKPTLFILNDEELTISEFSELKVEPEEFESVKVIQNPDDIRKLGYDRFNAVVKLKTRSR